MKYKYKLYIQQYDIYEYDGQFINQIECRLMERIREILNYWMFDDAIIGLNDLYIYGVKEQEKFDLVKKR